MPSRPRRLRGFRPPLTITQILAWADSHCARTGKWPHQRSGRVEDDWDESWSAINQALGRGRRGLEGGDSLAKLLLRERGRRHQRQPPLSEEKILAWADHHHAQTGEWPTENSGLVLAVRTEWEWWSAIDRALEMGHRGLPGRTSLAQLLARERGVRNHMDLAPLTEEQIAAWAEAHRARTGAWPKKHSGPVAEAPGEVWEDIDNSLVQGHRGLPGGDSLARLLARRFGVRNKGELPPLSEEQILAWADAHHQRTGRWPVRSLGPIPEAPGETWMAVHQALRRGLRGLPGGSSLAQFLDEHRGVPNRKRLRTLIVEKILAWADAYHQREGRWPAVTAGPIPEAPGETWCAVAMALRYGCRGLPGGDTLPRLLARHGRR